MKNKLVSFLLALTLLVSMIPISFAANTETPVIETIDLGDGFVAEITFSPIYSSDTMYISNSISRGKSATVRLNGQRIGTFELYGTFTYDGSSSKAIDDSWDATAISRYDYDGDSYCSGSSVKGSCTFIGDGYSKTASLTITCDRNGNIS